MRAVRRAALAALLLLASASPAVAAAPPPRPAGAPPAAVSAAASVALDQTALSVRIGQRFSFTSTLRNDGDQPMTGVVAHLNVLSLDPDVYVDPEDWSTSRTKYLDAIPAHESARLTWNVQAVNSGRFVLYVAVSEQQGTGAITASGALRLAATARRTVNAAGILPLAVAMPAVVLLAGFVARWRRRLR